MCLILSLLGRNENISKCILICILIIGPVSICSAGFVVSPMNITLVYPLQTIATFRCRHESGVRLDWLINGSEFVRFTELKPLLNFPEENSTIVEMLSITVTPEHNSTQVACMATVNGIPMVSSNATLTIILDKGQTTTETPTFTTGSLTIEAETSDFIQVPSPSLVVVALEETYTYYCNHSRTNRVFWQLNGTIFYFIVDLPLGIDGGIESFPGERRVSSLTIRGLLEYNKTRVQCIAELNGASIETPIGTFLVQGSLGEVTNIIRRDSTLSWEAPFTLDLTNVDPDIVYCVEVYNITCGRSLLINECDVMETRYTDDAILPGYTYEYSVTPRSNVEGASNETSLTVTEEFVTLSLSFKRHTLSMMDDMSKVIVTFHLDVNYSQNSLLGNHIHADLYSISLHSIDGLSDVEEEQSISDFIIRNESFIVFQIPLLFRRLWTYTLLAHGCDEHRVLNTTYLSTHDIQGISITTLRPGEIRVTGTFMQESTATGVLVAAVTNSKIYFYLLERVNFQVGLDNTISNVASGQHHISVFIIERNGLPVRGTATVPKCVMVVKGSINQSLPIEYELNSTSTGVCITCTFLDNSTTDCVVVVYQRVSQLSSSGLMNIESSHKFNRSGDTAYGCIEVVNLEQYQVGVMGGERKQLSTAPTDSSNSNVCTASCLGGVLATLIAIVLIIITLTLSCVGIIRKRQRTRPRTRIVTAVHLAPSETPRYEEVKLHVRIQSDGDGGTQVVADVTADTSAAQEVDFTTAQPTISDSDTADPAVAPVPFTLEHIIPELLHHAPKWKSLGEALSFDEDLLDEIFTNNVTDEDCLQNMLELYIARPAFTHSWEEINTAIKKVEDSQIKMEEASPDLGLKVHQDSQDQESEKEYALNSDSPQHQPTPQDDIQSHDASQEELSLDQQEHTDKEDYRSEFSKEVEESHESTSENMGHLESGNHTTATADTDTTTASDDKIEIRNIYCVTNCGTNSCAPKLFTWNTEYEGPLTVDQGTSFTKDIGSLEALAAVGNSRHCRVTQKHWSESKLTGTQSIYNDKKDIIPKSKVLTLNGNSLKIDSADENSGEIHFK